jgi:hypothetical protein
MNRPLRIIGIVYVSLSLLIGYLVMLVYSKPLETALMSVPLFSTGVLLVLGMAKKPGIRLAFWGFFALQCFLCMLTDWRGLTGLILHKNAGGAWAYIEHFEEGGGAGFMLEATTALVSFINAGLILAFVRRSWQSRSQEREMKSL